MSDREQREHDRDDRRDRGHVGDHDERCAAVRGAVGGIGHPVRVTQWPEVADPGHREAHAEVPANLLQGDEPAGEGREDEQARPPRRADGTQHDRQRERDPERCDAAATTTRDLRRADVAGPGSVACLVVCVLDLHHAFRFGARAGPDVGRFRKLLGI